MRCFAKASAIAVPEMFRSLATGEDRPNRHQYTHVGAVRLWDVHRRRCRPDRKVRRSRRPLARTRFIGRISFCHYEFHDAPFWKPGCNASHTCLYDRFIPLVFEQHLSFSPVAVVKLSDGELTFDCVPKIYRLLEAEIHSRCQPSNLSTDLSE